MNFAVVVSYNPNIDILSNLIYTLNQSDVKVIIVDNNSICDISKINIKNNELIILSENRGIAFAQNLGIAKALELSAENIIFFDQDSCIDQDFFNNLLIDYNKLVKENINIAAIGPRFIDEKKEFYFPALKFNKFGLIDKFSVENINQPIEVSFLISSGTLIPVKSLNEIGLMKEEFFIDFVDTEWCFRALSMGYKIFMSELAIMKHSIGDDTIRIFNFNIPVHSGFRRYYRIRNLFFMWKISYIPKILVAKLMITNFLIQVLLFLLKDKKKDYLKFYWKAIKDGIKQSKNYRI